jgi:hypothetical protein
MWAKCPYSWSRRYVEKEIIPPGIAMLTGTGVHAGAEVNFTQKIESHEDMPASDIVDAAVAGFESRSAGDGYMLTDEEATVGAKKVLGEARDQVAQLAGLHAKEQAPDYQPVVVEHLTRILLPNATHDLLAITDLRDNRGRVVDFKTAAKKPSKGTADDSVQLTIYSAAHAVDNRGHLPGSLRLDVLTKTKTPARHIQDTTRTPRDLQCLANRVNATLAAMQSGIHPPGPADAWWCGPKWCGYATTCRYCNPERNKE